MPHSAVSDLGLHCLSMSHKKDALLKYIGFKRKFVENHVPGFKQHVALPECSLGFWKQESQSPLCQKVGVPQQKNNIASFKK